MVLSIVLAALMAILAASLVLVIQGASGRMADRRATRMRAVWKLAVERRGRLTTPEVAQCLGLTISAAEVLLRSLVDEDTMTIGVDDRAGLLVYSYPSLIARAEDAHSESSIGEGASSSEEAANLEARPVSTKV